MRVKSAAAPVFALLLVTSAIIAAPTGYTGTAAASHSCDIAGALTFGVLNDGILGDEVVPGGCDLLHGDTDAESGIDKLETKESIVSSAAGASDQARTYLTATENNLQTSETIARQEGLVAYYRALENGSSKSQARIAAEEAIRDYYTTIQMNAEQSWRTYALNWVDYENLEASEGIDSKFLGWNHPDATGDLTNYNRHGMDTRSHTVTTINGTTIDSVKWDMINEGNVYDNTYAIDNSSGTGTYAPQAGLTNSTTSDVIGPKPNRYMEIWNDAANQSDQVIDGFNTYINQTFDEYQQGTLNATEIAGPNALAQEFSASGDFQNWAVLRLSQLDGADPPENISQVGAFRIDEGLNTHEGILLSGGNPDSGQFEAGNTYDSANISGTQYVVTNSSTVELTGQWTIESITNDEGQQINSTTINEVNYSVANTSDYKELLNEMDTLRAELNAREEATAGGGGLLGMTFGTPAQLAAVAVVAAGGYVVLSSGGLGGGGGSGGGGTTINYSERVKARRDKKRED